MAGNGNETAMRRDQGHEVWEKPKLTFEGTIEQVVLLGGAKLSIPTFDPGEEQRKPPGQE